MGVPTGDAWRAADNPRHLLRLSRLRPSGRKYLLLACAVVRHLDPGPRTPLAARVLDVIEKFAVAQPAKGVKTHVWCDVVQINVPELSASSASTFTRGQGAWLDVFEWRLAALSQVCPADINVLYDSVFRQSEEGARRAAGGEVSLLFSRLSPVFGPNSPPRLTLDGLREEVVSRVSPGRRAAALARWAGVTDEHKARHAAAFLVYDRVEEATAAARLKACELTREVFADPFRPPAIEPAWLAWNHGAARHVAESIAASGNFAELPILGDALEDAGCRDEELLRHCREQHRHVPGCWALDAVLGRG